MNVTPHPHEPLPPAPEIATTFAASVKSWWSVGEKQSAISEERLLRRMSFYKSTKPIDLQSDDGPVIAYTSRVELDAPQHFLNTLTIISTNPSPTAPPPAVLLHEFGAGLGFFFLNFNGLAQWAAQRGSAVYAIDWLGMGRSARVPFRVNAEKDDLLGRSREAEGFFIDSLEEWRAKLGIEKMTLIGHSLAGYLVVTYALKYPSRVNKLVSISPYGIPRGPDRTVPSRRPTDTSIGVQSLSSRTSAPMSPSSQLTNPKAKKQKSSQRVFAYFWEKGWTPFKIARALSIWAPLVIGKYSSQNFAELTEDDLRDLNQYVVNITLKKASGEHCMSHLSAPGLYVHAPLVDRIHAIKIPVTFVYGGLDGRRVHQGGRDAIELLRQAGNEQGRVRIIDYVGHHVYLDDPETFNKLLIEELDGEPLKTRTPATPLPYTHHHGYPLYL